MYMTIITEKDLNYAEDLAKKYFNEVKNKNVTVKYETKDMPFSDEFGLG